MVDVVNHFSSFADISCDVALESMPMPLFNPSQWYVSAAIYN